jgi:exodeoxyribonuclease-3
MKVATWNINSIRARRDRLLGWLDEHKPDVLCLQETKVTDELFPMEDLREHGYHAVFHGQKTYNGVAILSREPGGDAHRGFGDGQPDDEARLIAATCGGVRVISVYVPNGKDVGTDKYRYKLDWMKRLRAYLDEHARPDQPLVLAGDFNVAPDDRDVYDPSRFQGHLLCSDAERAALSRIVDWGLTDSFRLHHEDPGLYSWWDYRQLAFPKNRGLRIDMLYISAPLTERCTAAMIDRQARKGKGPSDHAPVIMELA